MESLKNSFIKYFGEKGYIIASGKGLKAENTKLLFNISGGVIFENYVEGLVLERLKVASVQRCLRTDSWEKIGFSGKHHVFFEMMGHFSFYVSDSFATKMSFVKDAVDFLFEVVKLPKNRIYLTIHPDDLESVQVARALSLDYVEHRDNITLSPNKRRSGYRIEIKWRRIKQKEDLELWNLVFTQYEDANFGQKMTKIVADSGMSLERLVAAKEEKSNNYECAFWCEYLNALKTDNCIPTEHLYRMADLLRSSIELFKEDIRPGKKLHEYVSRKIIRELFALLILYRVSIDRIVTFANFSQEYTKEYDLFLKTLRRGNLYIKKIKNKKQRLEDRDKKLLIESFGYPEILLQ